MSTKFSSCLSNSLFRCSKSIFFFGQGHLGILDSFLPVHDGGECVLLSAACCKSFHNLSSSALGPDLTASLMLLLRSLTIGSLLFSSATHFCRMVICELVMTCLSSSKHVSLSGSLPNAAFSFLEFKQTSSACWWVYGEHGGTHFHVTV